MFYPVNGDPFRSSVVLHLPMTGADNGTTFTDVSPTPKTITRYNAVTKTAVSKWGQGSGYFDGNGDYLTVPYSGTELNISTGDFTIECLVYLSNTTNQQAVFSTHDAAGVFGSRGCNLRFFAGGSQPTFYAGDTNTTAWEVGIYGASIGVGTRAHVAVTRSGNKFSIFVNGVVGEETTAAVTIAAYTNLSIGTILNSGTDKRYFSGYLQDLRITKGVARYTADFAPPAAPLPFRVPEAPIRRPLIQPPSFTTIARLGL